MFDGFQRYTLAVNDVQINLVKGGKGLPLLLLHGYPQNHIMWHKIAPELARNFTVIATDLRGYGDSSKPPATDDCSNYSKRVMAADHLAVMEQLGYEEFSLIGHDRGARVAHRLTLDYPNKVKKLVLLDIAPTLEMYITTDKEFASAYYHWFFLIQPYPFPETLIEAHPDYFLEHCLKSWSQDFTAFTPEALSEYRRCFRDVAMIRGTCADYRASATIDLEQDRADINQKIQCPVLVLWGKKGFLERKYDVLALWRERALNVTGKALNCGHFPAEEAPDETYKAILNF